MAAPKYDPFTPRLASADSVLQGSDYKEIAIEETDFCIRSLGTTIILGISLLCSLVCIGRLGHLFTGKLSQTCEHCSAAMKGIFGTCFPSTMNRYLEIEKDDKNAG